VAKVLVANKCDRPDKVIDGERGRQLAEQHGLTFFETSAKSGLNVNDVFQHIAKVIVNEKLQSQIESGLHGKPPVNGTGSGGMGYANSTIKMG
jgi:GTPase SAR1 family protein